MVAIGSIDVALQNFIGGRPERTPEATKIDPVVDPATGEVLAEVAGSSADDVDDAVARRREAPSPAWAATTPGERSGRPARDRRPRSKTTSTPSTAIESRNVGKPIAATPEEITFAADNLRLFAERRGR